MATNKHATIRYQALDKCFRNPGKRYYMEDLIEVCNAALYEFTGADTGIKRRQIFEDIKFMESPQGWNVPLEHYRDGHKVYYRYSDLNFSINNQPLNETEQIQLKEALLTLSRFKGMPQFEWIDELSARLDSGLKLHGDNRPVIEFDQNHYLTGLEFITPLYAAIVNKQALIIMYKSFRSENTESIQFHPYFLKQYNNRWFVFGKNHLYEGLQNLALDRILRIDQAKIKYVPNHLIDFQEYFEDFVGVSVRPGLAPETIELKISNTLFPYIESKPMHGSQKIKERHPEFTRITLYLIPNYELESLLLSYGEGIEVLRPAELRVKIKQRLETAFTQYN